MAQSGVEYVNRYMKTPYIFGVPVNYTIIYFQTEAIFKTDYSHRKAVVNQIGLPRSIY